MIQIHFLGMWIIVIKTYGIVASRSNRLASVEWYGSICCCFGTCCFGIDKIRIRSASQFYCTVLTGVLRRGVKTVVDLREDCRSACS